MKRHPDTEADAGPARPDAEPRATPRQERGREHGRRPWIAAAALVVLLVGLYFLWPAYEWAIDRSYLLVREGDREGLREWVSGAGALGPVAVLALMLAQTLFPFVPSVLIMVVAVLAYGAWWGGLLAWGGLLLSASVAYSIGRALGTAAVDRLIGEEAERRIGGYVRRHGVGAVIAARLSPAVSTDAVSYVAGIVGMRFPRFLAATAVGILPLTVLIGYLGASIERLSFGLLWISVASLGAFAAWVIFDRVRHGRPSPEEEGRI